MTNPNPKPDPITFTFRYPLNTTVYFTYRGKPYQATIDRRGYLETWQQPEAWSEEQMAGYKTSIMYGLSIVVNQATGAFSLAKKRWANPTSPTPLNLRISSPKTTKTHVPL